MNDTIQHTTDLIKVTFDRSTPSITIGTNWYVVATITALIVLYYLWGRKYTKRLRSKLFVGETNVKIKTPVFEYQNKIIRSQENLYVANRIYIELVTRKAAIPFDEENDVIKEIYDSWYSLFTSIRNEIKTLPSEFLNNHKSSNELIDLTTKILNDGLRPHLTIHQARFRKWYKEELEKESSKGKSPQEIQINYPNYLELIGSMKDVNSTLKEFSNELKTFINS